MTTIEFFWNVAAIAAVMAALALVEVAVPLFARPTAGSSRRRANLGLTALTLGWNALLATAAGVFALALSLEGGGLLAGLGLSLPVLVAITVVTLDLATYAAHRAMHAIPFLWRVHRVHHSDRFLDVTTTFRQHPIEGVWRFLWIIVPVWVLGLPAAGVVAYRLASALQAVLEHANLRLWRPLERPLTRVWVTPNMHKVHHSREARQTDSNFGNLFSTFDRAFGTFRPSDEAFGVVYGLDEVDAVRAASWRELLALPFRREPAPEGARLAPAPVVR